MTRKLYWEDAYAKDFDAVVIRSAGTALVLDRTAFYPTSGGQLNDTGKIIAGGNEYRVVDVREESGGVLHILDREFDAEPGDAARGMLDWERRYSLMKYHTALHVLCAVVEARYSGGWKGGMIYTDKAHVDFDLPALNKDLAAVVVHEVNAALAQGHNVASRFMTQEEALANPHLAKTEPGKELIKRLTTVRIVEIENLDIQMDGGTHVLNTREVGKIRLGGFDNKGAHRKRVEIVIE